MSPAARGWDRSDRAGGPPAPICTSACGPRGGGWIRRSCWPSLPVDRFPPRELSWYPPREGVIMRSRGKEPSFEEALSGLEEIVAKLESGETRLEEAGRPFEGGGLLSAGGAVGGDEKEMLPFACAVEYIHTYSLIHDDLPAMDDDDFRRGRPSCHKAFGEAEALRAGDALLTEAFRVMGESRIAERDPGSAVRAMAMLARASGACGMAGGATMARHPPRGRGPP